MRSFLQHSTPFLIVTVAAGLAALSAQNAVTFASLAASSSGTAPAALLDAKLLINLLWAALIVPPALAVWSYYRAQSLTGLALAGAGLTAALLILGTFRTVGFETDRLIASAVVSPARNSVPILRLNR